MRLFQNLFSPKPLLNFYQKQNVLREDSSRFSALCDSPETIKNFFEKFLITFFLNFLFFFKVYCWERWVFAVFSWGRIVFETYAYPFGYFWRWNFNVLLPLVLRMILLIWFSKVRKCLRSTASPLCLNNANLGLYRITAQDAEAVQVFSWRTNLIAARL